MKPRVEKFIKDIQAAYCLTEQKQEFALTLSLMYIPKNVLGDITTNYLELALFLEALPQNSPSVQKFFMEEVFYKASPKIKIGSTGNPDFDERIMDRISNACAFTRDEEARFKSFCAPVPVTIGNDVVTARLKLTRSPESRGEFNRPIIDKKQLVENPEYARKIFNRLNLQSMQEVAALLSTVFPGDSKKEQSDRISVLRWLIHHKIIERLSLSSEISTDLFIKTCHEIGRLCGFDLTQPAKSQRDNQDDFVDFMRVIGIRLLQSMVLTASASAGSASDARSRFPQSTGTYDPRMFASGIVIGDQLEKICRDCHDIGKEGRTIAYIEDQEAREEILKLWTKADDVEYFARQALPETSERQQFFNYPEVREKLRDLQITARQLRRIAGLCGFEQGKFVDDCSKPPATPATH